MYLPVKTKTSELNSDTFVILTTVLYINWSHSAVGNVSDCRYMSVCQSGVASLIWAQSHTFVEIRHEIISTAILPSADSRRVGASYRQKYVHKVLVNCVVKLAQEKKCG